MSLKLKNKSAKAPRPTVKKQKPRPIKKKKPEKPRVKARFSLSLCDYMTVEVTGFNQTKMLKRLTDEGIKVTNIEKIANNRMKLRLEKKDSEKTFAIFSDMCYNYSVVEYDGVFAYLKSAVKRVGIIVGTLACMACSFVLSGYVMRVEIGDLERIGKLELLSYLKEENIGVGSKISSLDRDEIRRVINAYEGVAESSVELNGTTLKINVIERDVSGEAPEKKQVILSRYDATVTRVVCSGGTAKAQIGRIVKRGDVLIEGALYDQAGEKLKDVPAEGIVYGKIVKNSTRLVSLDAYEYARTGKQKRVTSLNVFGLEIGKLRSPFETFESETHESELSAFLPVKVKQVTYYETSALSLDRSLEELVKSLEDEALRSFLDSAKELSATSHVTDLGENVYKIDTYVEAEIIIS